MEIGNGFREKHVVKWLMTFIILLEHRPEHHIKKVRVYLLITSNRNNFNFKDFTQMKLTAKQPKPCLTIRRPAGAGQRKGARTPASDDTLDAGKTKSATS